MLTPDQTERLIEAMARLTTRIEVLNSAPPRWSRAHRSSPPKHRRDKKPGLVKPFGVETRDFPKSFGFRPFFILLPHAIL